MERARVATGLWRHTEAKLGAWPRGPWSVGVGEAGAGRQSSLPIFGCGGTQPLETRTIITLMIVDAGVGRLP
jgi:hypothetical protein